MPHGGATTRPSKPGANPAPTRRHRQLEENQNLNHQRCPSPPPTCPLPSQKHRSPGRLPIREQRQKVQRQAQAGPSPGTEDRRAILNPRVQKPREPLPELLHPSEGSIPKRRVPQTPGQPQNGGTTTPRPRGLPPHTPQRTIPPVRINPVQPGPGTTGRQGMDRVAALDPGIRTFITWFSETDAGHIAQGAFGRVQRLCQPPGQPHRQNRQGAPDQTPKPSEGRRKDAQPHSQPDR